jgi:hypothetical protein
MIRVKKLKMALALRYQSRAESTGEQDPIYHILTPKKLYISYM